MHTLIIRKIGMLKAARKSQVKDESTFKER
jgi:hypothetical protein